MNLQHLSDEKLLRNFRGLADLDRKTMVETLHYFREVEARRLFSKKKFKSLREFGIEFLKYSADETDRRIAAMRMMRELPGIETSILDGSLNMTNIIIARTLFRKEKKAGRIYTSAEKREILRKFENVSTRKAQRIASDINPEMRKRELSFEDIQDDCLREKLLKLKGQRAHKNPYLSLTELLHELADKALEVESPAAPRMDSDAQVSRDIWSRDHAECSNCGSNFAVQEDHRIPKAANGEYTAENMRLLCRNCNQRAAIEFFGQDKMNSYLRDRFRPYGSARAPDH